MKSNGFIIGLYCVCFLVLFYLLRNDIKVIQTLLIIQGILFLFALTPIFEQLMRTLNHVYRPNLKESEEVKSIFVEVYENAKVQNPNLSEKIELFISNDMEPNAFAMASNTVVITKGAMNYFDEEELKGVLGHEFGHLSHWDTKILLLIMSSNLIILFFVLLIRAFCFIIQLISGSTDDYRTRLIGTIKTILTMIISFFIHAFISLSRRQSENMADEFACMLGYGTGLINALYKIQTLEIGQKLSLKEKIMSDHPETDRRIKRLEMIC